MGEEMGFKNPQETIWEIEHDRIPRPERLAVVRQFLDAIKQDDDPNGTPVSEGTSAGAPMQSATIAEVMAWARARVAEIAGVRVDAVKLDLRLES